MLCSLARQLSVWVASLAAVVGSVGCGADGHTFAREGLGQNEQRFVNGADDRREYFELSDPVQRATIEQSSVALMTASAAAAVSDGHAALLPSWGVVNALCDGEPFADQPSAAFCSGVLLDWDLVLTSGHCIDAVPLEQLRVAFGYYYRAEGELAMAGADSYAVASVITSRRDPAVPNDDGERLDYAWLELEDVARAPHRPAPAYTLQRGLSEGDAVISIGAGGGIPIKWDAGGSVQYDRADFDDYFIANTDTSQGSSGGGVFDQNLVVVGSLARGAADFTLTRAGCFSTNVEPDPGAALEQFNYVHRAVEGLCAAGSTSALCSAECGEPCDAGAREPQHSGRRGGDARHEDDGCSIATGEGAGHTPGEETPPWLALAVAATFAGRRRRAHQ